jgi:hypothetical protein
MAHTQRLEDMSSDDEASNLAVAVDDVSHEAHDDAIIFEPDPNGKSLEDLLSDSVAEQARIRILLSKSEKKLKSADAKLAKREECTDTIKEKLITKHREEKRRLRNDLSSDKEDLQRRIRKINAEHKDELQLKKMNLKMPKVRAHSSPPPLKGSTKRGPMQSTTMIS